MATHFSILAWRIHGQRSLLGYSPWGHKGSDTTEQYSMSMLKEGEGMNQALNANLKNWELIL